MIASLTLQIRMDCIDAGIMAVLGERFNRSLYGSSVPLTPFRVELDAGSM
jgi:hypothetical protein